MKALLLLLPFLLVSCTTLTVNDHSGFGDIDRFGKALGEWTLYSDNNDSIFAEGNYVDGRPDGAWKIYDNSGTKNAELYFKDGVYHGEYRLYYTSYTPEAVGRLKTIGSCEYGNYSGDFTRYLTDGSILVHYSVSNNSIHSVHNGGESDAREQLRADKALLKVYYTAILKAPGKQSVSKQY